MNKLLRSAAVATLLPLAACAPEAEPGGSDGSVIVQTPCEELGARVDSAMDGDDYVLHLKLLKVGNSSITGQIVTVDYAKNQDVCERFNSRDKDKPLQIHSNYDVDGTWGSHRNEPCTVYDGGKQEKFSKVRDGLAALLSDSSDKEVKPDVIVTVKGKKRDSYKYTSDKYDDNQEQRDVCSMIRTPGQ